MSCRVGASSFASLAEAVSAASPGCDIFIDGAVEGDTVIPSSLKGIRIKAGSPAGRVTASGGLAVISCLAEGVLIEGLSLENKGECSCVEVSRGASLTLVGCTIVAHGGSGVDVCGGKVEASNCTFSNCGQYGAIAREGGSFQGHTVTLASNGKTGLLARGQGSSVSVDTNSFMGKNGGNGVGCDGGGHVELKNSSVADNKLVGVMVGPVGTALLSSCEVTGSGMHGVAVSSGTVKASDTQFRKSRQLGAMVTSGALTLERCEIEGSGAHGILAQNGGTLKATELSVSRSSQSGIVVLGGSADVSNSDVSHNDLDGFHVGKTPAAEGGGGSCVMSNVDVLFNKRFGVSVFDATSSAALKDCQLADNGGAPEGGHGLAVVRGGTAKARTSRLRNNAQSGAFVLGGPAGQSRLDLVGCTVENNKVGVQAQGGGSANVAGGAVRGNTEQDVVGSVVMSSGMGGAALGVGIVGAIAAAALAVFILKRAQAKQ